MKPKEIAARLINLNEAFVDRFGKRPYLGLTLDVSDSAECRISIYRHDDCEQLHCAKGKTFAECLDAADAFIASLPSPDEIVQRGYLEKVAAAVDYATEHSIADEYVAPLRGVSKSMTDNLLTKVAQ